MSKEKGKLLRFNRIEAPKLTDDSSWLVNLRDKPNSFNLREKPEKTIEYEWNESGNIRFMFAEEQPEEVTIFVVDADNGTHAIGLDGKPRDMKPDLTPCSCDEYRKQGIEEGWIDE